MSRVATFIQFKDVVTQILCRLLVFNTDFVLFACRTAKFSADWEGKDQVPSQLQG